MNWFRGYQTGNWFLLNEAPKKQKKNKKTKIYNVLWKYKINSYMRHPKKPWTFSLYSRFFFLCPNGCKQPSRGKKLIKRGSKEGRISIEVFIQKKKYNLQYMKSNYEVWEPIRLSNLIYKQMLIAMNI